MLLSDEMCLPCYLCDWTRVYTAPRLFGERMGRVSFAVVLLLHRSIFSCRCMKRVQRCQLILIETGVEDE